MIDIIMCTISIVGALAIVYVLIGSWLISKSDKICV